MTQRDALQTGGKGGLVMISRPNLIQTSNFCHGEGVLPSSRLVMPVLGRYILCRGTFQKKTKRLNSAPNHHTQLDSVMSLLTREKVGAAT